MYCGVSLFGFYFALNILNARPGQRHAETTDDYGKWCVCLSCVIYKNFLLLMVFAIISTQLKAAGGCLALSATLVAEGTAWC